MMKKSILVLAVCAALTLASIAAPSAQKATTVGEFVQKVSVALGYKAATPKAAAEALRLDVDLSARLTEATAARILGDLGYKVTVANPSREISPAKANQLVATVSLSSAAAVSPEQELPGQCLQSVDRGTCVECCKAIVGSIEDPQGNPKDPGKICAKFCKQIIPGPPSEIEPQP